MLYVQIFIVVCEKRIKIEPTAFSIHAAPQAKKNFQYETALKESCGIRKARVFFSPVFVLPVIAAACSRSRRFTRESSSQRNFELEDDRVVIIVSAA